MAQAPKTTLALKDPKGDSTMENKDKDPRFMTLKEIYKKKKEEFKASPAYIKQKEEQKQRRHEIYQAQKAKRKTKAKEQKDALRSQKIQAREEKDQALNKLVTPAAEASTHLRLVYSRNQRDASK